VLLGIDVVIHAHPFVEVFGEDLVKSGRQKILLGFEACERRTNWNGGGSLVVANQIQMVGHIFSPGLSLISLLLGQLEKTVCNSQIAYPDSLASAA